MIRTLTLMTVTILVREPDISQMGDGGKGGWVCFKFAFNHSKCQQVKSTVLMACLLPVRFAKSHGCFCVCGGGVTFPEPQPTTLLLRALFNFIKLFFFFFLPVYSWIGNDVDLQSRARSYILNKMDVLDFVHALSVS